MNLITAKKSNAFIRSILMATVLMEWCRRNIAPSGTFTLLHITFHDFQEIS